MPSSGLNGTLTFSQNPIGSGGGITQNPVTIPAGKTGVLLVFNGGVTAQLAINGVVVATVGGQITTYSTAPGQASPTYSGSTTITVPVASQTGPFRLNPGDVVTCVGPAATNTQSSSAGFGYTINLEDA